MSSGQRFPQSANPAKSTLTHGSSAAVQASCPGGIENTSPEPIASSVPASMRTIWEPDSTCPMCATSPLSAFTTDFTRSDHVQPSMKADLSLHTHQFKRAPREPEGGRLPRGTGHDAGPALEHSVGARTNQSLGTLARIVPLGPGVDPDWLGHVGTGRAPDY